MGPARSRPARRTGLRHRVPWAEMLRDVPEPHVRTLRDARSRVLRLLFELPAGVDVHLAGFAATVADRIGLPDEPCLTPAVAAVFLDPLVALGAAQIAPPQPAPPRRSAPTRSAIACRVALGAFEPRYRRR